MSQKKIPGGPLWYQWARTVVSLLLFAEYMRLVLTTDVASYRVAVTGVLAIVFGVSLVSLVRAIRYKSKLHES
jgi:hypothetical protein